MQGWRQLQADQRAAAYGLDPGWRGSAAQRDRHARGESEDRQAHRRRNTAAAFSRRIVPGQGQGIADPWDLALGQGEGRGQRRTFDAGSQSLGLGSAWSPGPTMALSVPPANSDVLDENGEAKIIIE